MLTAVTLEDRIKEIMASRGVSLTELAAEIHISRATLYAAFAREKKGGEHNIDHTTARALAVFADKSVEWILTGEEPAAPAIPVASPPDTLAMAREAAQMLVDVDDLSPDEAWLLLRDVRAYKPSVQDIYKEARRLRKRQSDSRGDVVEHDMEDTSDEAVKRTVAGLARKLRHRQSNEDEGKLPSSPSHSERPSKPHQ